MFDRNKVYGHTYEEIRESFGLLNAENEIMEVGDPTDILTKEEIDRMFPEQVLLLGSVTYNGPYDGFDRDESGVISASVLLYKCPGYKARGAWKDHGYPEEEMVYSTITHDFDDLGIGIWSPTQFDIDELLGL